MTVRTARPKDAGELSQLLSESGGPVRLVGGDTKRGLRPAIPEARTGEELVIETADLRGVVEYQPSEFTVTVRAGEPIKELEQLLAGHGQYLPFDPILVDAGATVGGALAAGISGPGRLRFGGVRDFVLAVQLVDGRGRVIRGGSGVVKNAAGFDLPKLLVGSAGQLGAIVEATLKVFPMPAQRATVLGAWSGDAAAAGGLLASLGSSQLDLEAVELLRSDGDSACQLAVRILATQRVSSDGSTD